MTTIGVISDTHIRPGGRRLLPPRIFDLFASVDLIFHAGDLNTMQVVADLEAIAPVVAVHGNNDDGEVMARLPPTRQMQIEECWIGLAHGDRGHPQFTRSTAKTPANALSWFEGVDCVVFGHSHRSLVEWLELPGGRVLLFNPGSPTDKRWGPHHSCGLLRVDGRRLEPELFTW